MELNNEVWNDQVEINKKIIDTLMDLQERIHILECENKKLRIEITNLKLMNK